MFICMDRHQREVGTGNTLEEAFDDYRAYHDDDAKVDDCLFYETGDEIEVEVKITKKEVVTSTIKVK